MTPADRRKWDKIKALHARGASVKQMSTGTGVKSGTVRRLLELKRAEFSKP